jgi:hypothetical protein
LRRSISNALSLEAQLDQARGLILARDFDRAVDLYEAVLAEGPNTVLGSLNLFRNLQLHKEFLKRRLLRQMALQKNLGDGFRVNLGGYGFLPGAASDIFVTPKCIAGVDKYKAPSGALNKLRTDVDTSIGQHPNALTLIYYAHSVAADIVDMCIVSRNFPMTRVADFGSGSGLQALTLAKLMPQISSLSLFEPIDYMQEAIAEVFAANGVQRYTLNQPMPNGIDFFYSFRACGFLFSVEAYTDEMRRVRTPHAAALMDIGTRFDKALQKTKMLEVFKEATVFYPFGQPPDDHDRTLFDGVA